MIIAFLLFLVLGLVMAVVPGAILGCVFVVVTGRLSRGARVTLLLVLAAGSAAMWLVVVGAANIWRPAIVMVSFTATLGSAGVTFLVHEARKRRAPQSPTAAGPVWCPPVDSR